jgi:phosphoglycolate phosphatase-like HAD superfamily hydrolase
MSLLQLGDLLFDADLIAFDKDGTLLDFEYMWGRLAEAWAKALTADWKDEDLEQELHHSWGYDPRRRQTIPQSPLAIASKGQLQTVAAVVLFRRGVPWPEAEDRTRVAFQRVGVDLPLTDLIRPLGDVAGLFTGLRGSGVRVAIVTTDRRPDTERTLQILGVDHLVECLVCGDDGLAIKPAPDMLLAACKALGVDPNRTAVVGDTVADLLMAQRAGAGCKAAVLTGAGNPVQLRAHADVVMGSINDITVERQA